MLVNVVTCHSQALLTQAAAPALSAALSHHCFAPSRVVSPTTRGHGFSYLPATFYSTTGRAAARSLAVCNVGITRGFAAQATPAAELQPQPSSHPSVTPGKAAQANGPEVPESQPDAAASRCLGKNEGNEKDYASGCVVAHPGLREFSMSPPTQAYDPDYLRTIAPTHQPPKDLPDRLGLFAVKLMRGGFDLATGYGADMTEAKWLRRIIFLETVAGVPGMVAGMLRHLHSLRAMRRDSGWIHCLLEEAENERMHLLTFMELRQPGPLFRAMVLLAQGVFFNAYFLAYLLSPRTCHAFVGYLEEEAVRTYTHALQDIQAGKLWKDRPAPDIAIQYWGLKPGASMYDLILAVRADEACHSHVNHTLKALKPTEPNPFAAGKSQLP